MNERYGSSAPDRATSERLSRLATRPVDVSRLEQRFERVLREATADTPEARGPTRLALRRWWAPIAGVAAAAVVVASLAVIAIDGGATPARAAPLALAQLHRDLSSGRLNELAVSSVAEANALLADQARGAAPIPDLPGRMRSCCLAEHAGATLTMAMIERGGRRISVAVANGGVLDSPEGEAIERSGRRLIVHTAGGVRMVMAHEGGRWLCVMGEASTDELADVAAAIRF